MQVCYEWDLEQVDPETDEVIDHFHADRLLDLGEPADDDRLVLVRDTSDRFDLYGVQGREWAYVEDGQLPEYFSDGSGAFGAKVPKRFHTELARYGHRFTRRQV